MKHVVGTVTIGQTPRTDVIPELSAILGDVTIREAGALDGLSRAEIAGLAPQRGDYVLVTRLADGSSVQVAERHITPRVAAKIKEHFDAGVPLVLLLHRRVPRVPGGRPAGSASEGPVPCRPCGGGGETAGHPHPLGGSGSSIRGAVASAWRGREVRPRLAVCRCGGGRREGVARTRGMGGGASDPGLHRLFRVHEEGGGGGRRGARGLGAGNGRPRRPGTHRISPGIIRRRPF